MSIQTTTDPFDSAVQSRPSISEPSLHSGPLPLFEHHLRVLTDSFLNFFQERKRIEEIYVESLLKLHRKTKSIDAFLDDRTDMSTARRAWGEVRDNVEREAQTRQAFLTTLTLDAVNTLMALKETQERTRKRIKEDLKSSISAYSDYAENTLPKLKRTYLKKCQEVEVECSGPASLASLTHTQDYKLTPASTPQPPSNATSGEPGVASMPNSRSNPVLPSRPVVAAPQPLRPIDRRPSGTTHVARNRSPSTSGTSFSDFAQHGKKQFNQLMTFLDKGPTVKETLGVRSENNALRAVRVKREADEADKEYRKGVYWLETLRLRRTKILESAYTSLESFIRDYSGSIKSVLEKYTDNMTATTMTQTQLSEHANSMITKISPENDVSLVTTHIPRALSSLIPKSIFYYNYNVGECSDLIFGVSLVDYATSRGLGETEIPKIVRICIQEIDERGLESEGIYRVSGRYAVVQDLQHKIERNEAAFKFNRLTDDVYAASSLLKLYLRQLPEPLFKYTLSDRTEHTEGRVGDPSPIAQMRSKIRRLPAVHRETLRAIVEHLARVASFSEKNKMDVRNLAIVFGTVIFGEEDIPKGGDLLSVQSIKDPRMDDLIQNASQLFDDPLPSNSPPLPDAPPGEPAPVYNYGSSHTRVGSVLPRPLSPRQNEDFTPRLPLRPAYSIHPSLRAGGPVSPIQATMDIPPIPHPFEELISENTNTSAEPNVTISPPPSLSALSPHPSSVSLPAASDFPVHQRNESSSSNF
ncbi:hypothetical protein HD554DRAFT_2202498 [Boletus coccyginus]|nr:hypothetical protein HD554DRAFT_2202498 [Boletus coccyginus]